MTRLMYNRPTMQTNWLLTGRPGVGKTTLVRRVLQQLAHLPAAGFYTQEIRSDGRRVGFRVVTLSGEEGTLAHVEIQSDRRVGRYGVDVVAFERAALPSLEPATGAALVVVDEIGKMECFSRAFREAVVRALGAETPVLATIARRGDRFIEGLKAREDVTLVEVARGNRDRLVDELAAALKERVVEARG
jgi:nucleoside-triphosphatase